MPMDIRKPLKKFLPHLLQAQTDSLNEADTVQRLIKCFEVVLGYDPMEDVSREANMKGKYVDVVLKVDGAVRLLIEAKAASETLRDRHIDQAQSYAAQNNYPWVVLTNGVRWTLYRLTFGEGIEYARAWSIDLSDAEQLEASAASLALLHKASIKRGELDEFWEHATALRPDSIARALFQEHVLSMVRREIRRDTGLLVDPEDLARAIHGMLSAEARELVGPVRVRKRRVTARKPTTTAPPEAGEPEETRAIDHTEKS